MLWQSEYRYSTINKYTRISQNEIFLDENKPGFLFVLTACYSKNTKFKLSNEINGNNKWTEKNLRCLWLHDIFLTRSGTIVSAWDAIAVAFINSSSTFSRASWCSWICSASHSAWTKKASRSSIAWLKMLRVKEWKLDTHLERFVHVLGHSHPTSRHLILHHARLVSR